MLGGLARRAFVFDVYKGRDAAVLTLDNGGFFPDRGNDVALKAQIMGHVMNEMGYSAIMLGLPEFNFGIDFVKDIIAEGLPPVVVSNLFYRKTGVPFARQFLMVDFGAYNVAVLGVLPVDEFASAKDHDSLRALSIRAPEEVLELLLPEIRGQADAVVLMSRLSQEDTSLILDRFPEIDVAISGRVKLKNKLKETQSLDRVFIVPRLGKELGSLTLKKNERRMVVIDSEVMELDRTYLESQEIADYIDQRFREANIRKKEEEIAKAKEMIHKEAKELWKMAPMEFFINEEAENRRHIHETH